MQTTTLIIAMDFALSLLSSGDKTCVISGIYATVNNRAKKNNIAVIINYFLNV